METGSFGLRVIATRITMVNQMEKKIKHYMEIGTT